jgi:DnaJ-class molecular chaperone
MSEKIDCPECLGKGYVEEGIGGGNARKFRCEKCNGKGTIELEEKENRDE